MIHLKSGGKIKTKLKPLDEYLLGGLIRKVCDEELTYDRYVMLISNASVKLNISTTVLTYIITTIQNDNNAHLYELFVDFLTDIRLIKINTLDKNPDDIGNLFNIVSSLQSTTHDLYQHYVNNGGCKSKIQFGKLIKETAYFIKPTRLFINGKSCRGYTGIGVKP